MPGSLLARPASNSSCRQPARATHQWLDWVKMHQERLTKFWKTNNLSSTQHSSSFTAFHLKLALGAAETFVEFKVVCLSSLFLEQILTMYIKYLPTDTLARNYIMWQSCFLFEKPEPCSGSCCNPVKPNKQVERRPWMLTPVLPIYCGEPSYPRLAACRQKQASGVQRVLHATRC